MKPNEDGVAVQELETQNKTEPQQQTFVETALKLSGKSDDEARRTGAVDRADEQVEALFEQRRQTTASPIHRAVWEAELPADLFVAPQTQTPPAAQKVMDAAIAAVDRHRKNGSL